jgi:hypothetical protein
VRRLPNSPIARCHRDREIPNTFSPSVHQYGYSCKYGGEASIPAIYSNGEVKRGQDPNDAERIRNWTK